MDLTHIAPGRVRTRANRVQPGFYFNPDSTRVVSANTALAAKTLGIVSSNV